ncbi:Coiled-coil domain-containing protein [Trichostrongylus colubriformis]|uniref:Coiled-coil domain-containing protein n=1 Tax=Trichostrongylus colubriformis TaxID=6319 RepID=A0AAN8F9V1_TRICO
MELGPSRISVEEYRNLQEKVQQLQSRVDSKTETIARSLTLERNLERVEMEVHKYAANEVDMRTSFKLEKQKLTDEIESLRKELSAAVTENAELKAEKIDLQKNCKLFRQRIAKFEIASLESPSTPQEFTSSLHRKPSEDVGTDGLGKYEKLYKEFKQIETDLHAVLGIKEELVMERDALVKKVERLTTEMSFLLNGDPRRVAEDLDTLIAENRFLKARLDSANEESETMKATLSKYRAMTESRPSTASPVANQDSSLGEKSSVAVVNMKQIRELLSSHAIKLDDNDYKAITAILLDLCNDKQMALTHLRRANKVLGNRVNEVESHLAVLEAKSRSTSPNKPS